MPAADRFIELALAVMGSVAITLAIVVALQPRPEPPQRIVMIDPARAVLGFINDGRRDLPKEAYAEELKDFQDALEAEIERLSVEHGLIVVNSASVLGGAEDVTPQILRRVNRLREERGELPPAPAPQAAEGLRP